MTKTRTTEVVTVDEEKLLRITEAEDNTRAEVESRLQWLRGRIDKYTSLIAKWEAEETDLELKLREFPDPKSEEP